AACPMSMSTGRRMPSRSGEHGAPVTHTGGPDGPGGPAADPADWVERAVGEYPDRLFVRTPVGTRCSYAQLADGSGRIASTLRALGAQAGDRVVVRVEKSLEAVLLYVACLRLGAVFVPVNTAYTPSEVEYFLRDSQPRIAVVDPADQAILEPLARQAGVG